MEDLIGALIGIVVVIMIIGWLIQAAIYLIGMLLKGILFGFSYIGQTVFIPIDYLAHGLVTIGITNPAAAWVVLGVLIGGMLGLAEGFKRAGKKSARAVIYLSGGGIVLALLLLSSGRTAPKYRSHNLERARDALIPEQGQRAWWEGVVGNSLASLETRASDDGTGSIGVATFGGVKETVNIRFDEDGTVTMQGVTYQRQSGNGSFALDRFQGRLLADGVSFEGNYADAAGRGGKWRFRRVAIVPWPRSSGKDAGRASGSLGVGGQWVGTIRQPGAANPEFSASVEVTRTAVGQVAGTVRYLELRCLANLTYRGVVGTAFRFDQTVASGTCANGSFQLEPAGDEARFQWLSGGAATPGRGQLRRVGGHGLSVLDGGTREARGRVYRAS